MGSGTTGIACIRTGRNFIGIEHEAHESPVKMKTSLRTPKRLTEAKTSRTAQRKGDSRAAYGSEPAILYRGQYFGLPISPLRRMASSGRLPDAEDMSLAEKCAAQCQCEESKQLIAHIRQRHSILCVKSPNDKSSNVPPKI